jgi:hypothetical protein
MTPEEKKEKNRIWREKNKEVLKEKKKLQWAKNKWKYNERRRQYYLDHAEEIKAKVKLYSKNNKEKVQTKGKAYRLSHKEEKSAYDKKWRQEHKEHKSLRDKEYREKNAARCKERQRQYYLDNKEIISAKNTKAQKGNPRAKACHKRYEQRKVANLTDSYIQGLIHSKTGLPAIEIYKIPNAIMLKKVEIASMRYIKNGKTNLKLRNNETSKF